MTGPFRDDPLYGHPWQTPQEHAAKRRARHALWRSRLTDRDWARIQALAREVRPGYQPARLDDLDAPGIAVGVCQAGDEHLSAGERIGAVRDETVAILVWVK